MSRDDHKPDDVESYKSLLPFRAVLRGAIARFLPASLISLAVLFASLGVPLTERAAGPVLWWGATMAVALTAGYLVGLEILRRLFPPVAAIDGRRSLVAGLVSPVPFFLVGSLGSPFNPPWGWLQAYAWMGIGGVALAVVAFFVRLTPARDRLLGSSRR